MPTFMVQASYTSPAWNKLVQRPENRMEALRPVVEKLGGTIVAWYYAFGDYDVVVLFDVPSTSMRRPSPWPSRAAGRSRTSRPPS